MCLRSRFIYQITIAEPILSNITIITTSDEQYQLQEIHKKSINTAHETTQKYVQ